MSQKYCIEIKRKNKRCVEPDCQGRAQGKTYKCIAH
jgi:hypothetical protein